MIISIFQTIAKPIFGDFEREEFKKFLRLGAIFSCIIGAYWTLRILKNAVFANLVGATYLPWAKTVSILTLFPLVMIYTKMLDRFSREKMFYILSAIYGILTLLFSILLTMEHIGQAPTEVIACRSGLACFITKVLGYAWYVFVESYGSLAVALFWAFTTDITKPESAKKGFAFIVALGQVGGIIGPYFMSSLPRRFGFMTSGIAVFGCAILTSSVIWLVYYFLRTTPKELLTSYRGQNEAAKEKEQEPGFLEGLKLLLSHGYLMGIFAVSFFFEFIVTIFDLHFQILAASVYSGTAHAEYLGFYGTMVNAVTLLCLLLGANNITRVFGITASLTLVPIIIAGAVFGFMTLDSLNFLLMLMVGSKAINYALNGPALKQLYIPTTHDVRFKAQAWIETFGSRASKEGGSIFNMSLAPLQKSLGAAAGRARHIMLSSYLGFGLVIAWFFIALFLGRTYKKAVDQNKVVC
jgi:AAA family ATP:ADP antiporter